MVMPAYTVTVMHNTLHDNNILIAYIINAITFVVPPVVRQTRLICNATALFPNMTLIRRYYFVFVRLAAHRKQNRRNPAE